MPDESKRPLKVFLCHASADKPVVRDLYKRLVADGVDAWLDAESLVPGQNWQVEIPKAIRESDVVIVCLSEKSINKEGYVQKEIKFALDVADEKPEGTIFIIPARLEECKVPDRLSLYHWVDLYDEDGYQKLMRALRLRADKIGAVLQSKKGWLNGFTAPVKKPAPKKPEPVEKKPIPQPEAPLPDVVKKSLRKLNIQMIAAIAGVIIVFAAMFGLPWNQWLVAAPDVVTITQTNTATFTALPQTLAFTKIPANKAPAITPTIPISTPALGIGSTLVSDKDKMTLMYVPEGEFTMGSDSSSDEQPIHKVTLDAFWIDQTEVTNKQYAQCLDDGVCQHSGSISSNKTPNYYENLEFANYPIIYVTWIESATYCKWANRRLPSEAEWEKAARGTDGRTYPWGNGAPNDTLLNYNQIIGDTTEVGKYPNGKSIYGAYDMAGNVWEWVNDWYSNTYYKSSPSSNPLGPDSGQYRVLRGGAWSSYDSVVRSAVRLENYPTRWNGSYGFRCARDANQ
jgi:formylglycine-generating enzyme required for sulfatase activity